MAKKDLIKKAKELGLEIPEKATVKQLKELIKTVAPEPVDTQLIERAKKIGLSDNQIESYPDVESLKKALDGMSPKTNPDARVKPGTPPTPKVHTEKIPDKVEIDSKFEAKFTSQSRSQFDENSLQAELRRINRKYGAHAPVKIIKTVTFKPVSGLNENKITVNFLITHFVIFFK
jgi:hypothetical protein